MGNIKLRIKSVNGCNYICPALLDKILMDRDEKIRRIERATETRRKQRAANTKEEWDKISVPSEFRIFGDYANLVMESYISGFALSDDNGTRRCYYGNMGAPASIVCPELYRGEICDYGTTSGYSSLGRFIRNKKCCSDADKYIQNLSSQAKTAVK